jgi:hypothetical protein
MQIWVVSSHGAPRAVFSTIAAAKDYIGGRAGHDVSCLLLDACDDRYAQRFLPRAANANRRVGTSHDGCSAPRE